MTCSLNRKLNRDLHRGRTVIGVKDPLKPMRNHLTQTFSESHRWLVSDTRKDDVIELLELRSGGTRERGMPVTVETTPPRGDSIQDLPAILKSKKTTFRRDNGKGLNRKS
jgi:hypothetical protein